MELITREQLKAMLDGGQDVKLVMAAGPWEFRAGHIPGSLGFPSPTAALRELRRDDEIVLYAADHRRSGRAAAYDALRAHGYRNVRCYAGGLADWQDAGYPVEGDAAAPAAGRPWPHGHSPLGRELHGACPHGDNGWSGYGWPLCTGGDGNRVPRSARTPNGAGDQNPAPMGHVPRPYPRP